MLILMTPIQHCIGSFSWCNKTRKNASRWKEEINLSLFVNRMIVYVENPIESAKKATKTNKRVQQYYGIEQHTKINSILEPNNGQLEIKNYNSRKM